MVGTDQTDSFCNRSRDTTIVTNFRGKIGKASLLPPPFITLAF